MEDLHILKKNIKYVAGMLLATVFLSACGSSENAAVSSSGTTVSGAIDTSVSDEYVSETTEESQVTVSDLAADLAKTEADSDARPTFNNLDIDPTSYSRVFIGYPIWWYRMSMIMETFFDTYDFDGVTIIPFNTHLGSRDGGTYDMIRDREPGATVLEGIPISGSDVGKDSSKEDIIKWLNGLDLD
jgi:hypothetical protein